MVTQAVLLRSINAAQLKDRRRALGLTQQELASALGVTSNTVARWERGEREIGQPQLVEIAIERLEQHAARSSPPPGPYLRATSGLPLAPNPLIGREVEVARLCELLLRPDVRLVTITGVGGAGKTRVSIEVASRLRASFADGAFFVDL